MSGVLKRARYVAANYGLKLTAYRPNEIAAQDIAAAGFHAVCEVLREKDEPDDPAGYLLLGVRGMNEPVFVCVEDYQEVEYRFRDLYTPVYLRADE